MIHEITFRENPFNTQLVSTQQVDEADGTSTVHRGQGAKRKMQLRGLIQKMYGEQSPWRVLGE